MLEEDKYERTEANSVSFSGESGPDETFVKKLQIKIEKMEKENAKKDKEIINLQDDLDKKEN